MSADHASRIDRARRFIAAPPATLFAAQLDPAALTAWLPPPGSSLAINDFHPKIGGTFRYLLRFDTAPGKTGAQTDEVTGRFVEITPPGRLVQEVAFLSDDPAVAGTMRMTWAFRPAPGGSDVEVTAENVPPGIAPEDHAAGLAASLDNLARYTET